jgi:hypothetical protein
MAVSFESAQVQADTPHGVTLHQAHAHERGALEDKAADPCLPFGVSKRSELPAEPDGLHMGIQAS